MCISAGRCKAVYKLVYKLQIIAKDSYSPSPHS